MTRYYQIMVSDIENALWVATAHREADEREYHPLRWLAGMRVCGLVYEPAYSKISYSNDSVWEEILRLPCQTDLEDGRAGGYSMSLEFLVLFFQEKSTEEIQHERTNEITKNYLCRKFLK